MTRFLLLASFCVGLFVMQGSPAFAADPEDTEVNEPERAPVGLDGVDLEEEEQGLAQKPKRLIIPPYVSEKTANTTFRTFLPLYFYKERVGAGARKDFGVLPFYWSHTSDKMRARVYFPLYWQFRGAKLDTDVVLQTHYSRNKDKFNFGFSPLFYFGKNRDTGKSYQVVLPPLFWNFKNKDGGFLYSLLYYDYRHKGTFSRGFVPFFFSRKKHSRTVTTVLPPLFWHVSDPVRYRTTTVLPPLFLKTRENGWSAGLVPILYFARDKNWSRNMVMPFYYGSRVNQLKSHYFPFLLSYWRNSPTLKQGGVAVFYHWYKHEGKYLNMMTPLAWRWGNTRTLEKNVLIPPLFYRGTSPVADKTMLGLLYWNFNDHHYKKTLAIAPLFVHQKRLYEDSRRTWVFPTFDFGKSPKSKHVRFHPLFYQGHKGDRKHLVLAPLVWHFDNPKDRNTVVTPLWWQFYDKEFKRLRRVVFPFWWQFDDVRRKETKRVLFPFYWDFHWKEKSKRTVMTFPPLYWRVRDANSARTGVLNISMHKGTHKGNRFWTFNLFPLVLFGKPPAQEGARWEILHGLLGWRRQGSEREFKFLWIPFSRSK